MFTSYEISAASRYLIIDQMPLNVLWVILNDFHLHDKTKMKTFIFFFFTNDYISNIPTLEILMCSRNKNSKTFRSSTVSCRNHSFNIHTQNVKDIVTVTGGSGFLGQHIIRTLQERADYVSEIRVLDIVPYKNLLGKLSV